jgi:hypothetical protein
LASRQAKAGTKEGDGDGYGSACNSEGLKSHPRSTDLICVSTICLLITVSIRVNSHTRDHTQVTIPYV